MAGFEVITYGRFWVTAEVWAITYLRHQTTFEAFWGFGCRS